jgi:hypothetical protein
MPMALFSFGSASFRLPQDPMNSVGKIGGDKIRLYRPMRSIPKVFALTVTRAHQDAASTGPVGKRNVSMTIANNEGLMQVDGMLQGRAIKHPRIWLAAIAAFVRGVRTRVNSI